MYIFGYFFQKGYFKGSSEKRAHVQKTLGGGLTTPLPPCSGGPGPPKRQLKNIVALLDGSLASSCSDF